MRTDEQCTMQILGLERKPEFSNAIGWSPYVQTTEYLDFSLVIEILYLRTATAHELSEIQGWPGTLVRGRLRSLMHREVIAEASPDQRAEYHNPDEGPLRDNQALYALSAKSHEVVRTFSPKRSKGRG